MNREALQRIEQAAAEQWEELDLAELDLTELPPEIAQLTGLQSLYLSENPLTTLPDAIAQLTALQKLDLLNVSRDLPPALLPD
jgi:internalin A